MNSKLFQVLIAIGSALVGAAATWAFTEYDNRTKYLSYATFSSNGILTPVYKALGSDSAVITIDNKRLSNISEFGVSVANLGSSDLGDIPIYVELLQKGGEPFKVISPPSFVDHNGTQDGVVALTGKAGPKNRYRYGFLVKTFNRQKDFRSSFVVRFLLEGDVEPDVVVHTDKVGVEIREFEVDETSKYLPILLYLAAGYTLGCIVFGLTNYYLRDKKMVKIYEEIIRNQHQKLRQYERNG